MGGNPPPDCCGKCHCSVLVGSRLLLFGGSMPTCNALAWLDLDSEQWGEPSAVKGPPPSARMSCTATLVGVDTVQVLGGYSRLERELGDLHLLRLAPSPDELAAATAKVQPRQRMQERLRQLG